MAYQGRAPRFQTEKIPIVIRLVGTFVWSKGLVLNLSSTGVQIYSPAKLAPGSDVEIEFTTANETGRSTRRRMNARIVWYSGGRYGCQFTRRL